GRRRPKARTRRPPSRTRSRCRPPSPRGAGAAQRRGRAPPRRRAAGAGSARRSPRGSLPQPVRRLDVDRLEALVDAEHDGEADRGLGGGEHDDEDGEHLPVVARVRVAGEGDVVDVGRVEHQLDAHQDADRVTPRDDGEEPEGEEDAPEHDEVAERERAHGGPYAFTSLRETTMAPTRAASRTSEAISNGSAYWRRNAFPIP